MIVGNGSYQTGVNDLQVLLSDQADDKYNFLQRCFGQVDGTNARFKTFFRRRSTNFTTASGGTVGVYIDNTLLPITAFASDDTESGVFVLSNSAIPADGSVVESSYYNQWFDQSELDTFLQVGARWLSSNNDYTQTAQGLVDALLKYSAAEGYLKLAQRWRSYMSQEFKVEDAPKDSPTYNTDTFVKMATLFRKEALDSRTEFYQTRQGRALQPLFGTVRGRIRNMP